MSSQALHVFEDKLANEAGILQEIVRKISGVARDGLELRLSVLHRSSIVLLTAAFETYCEGILTFSIEILSTLAQGPETLPDELRKNVAIQKGVPKNKSELFPWAFAEARWRDLLLNYTLIRVSDLNTPSGENIRKLFSDILGIEDITISWAGDGYSAESACDILDQWLEHRHGIAHGATAIPDVNVTNYENFLRHIVSSTDKTVESHLATLLGRSPW